MSARRVGTDPSAVPGSRIGGQPAHSYTPPMPPVSSRRLAPGAGAAPQDVEQGDSGSDQGEQGHGDHGPGGHGHGEHVDGTGAGSAVSPVAARDDGTRWVRPATLALLLAVPLVVALAALARPRWFPILDLAMTELRIRDVGTSNTPLIGLPGRIGVLGGDHGSHPGPLSFWLLAPTYRLFGASAWASEVATVVLHAVAMGTALWLARRRGGLLLMVGVAAVLATLARTYGAEMLTQPWNPYMPLLWWFVLLLAVWSVLCRDVVALPIVVVAGSICAQTHAPYVGLVAGMVGVTLVGAFVAHRRAEGRPERSRVLRWTAGAAVLGVLLWLAPVIDQLTVDPGNISLLADHFGSPPEEAVGIGRGVEMVLLHLDPWRLVTEQGAATGSLTEAAQAPTGSPIPGLLLLAVWAAAVAVAWRLRHAALLRLHLVCGVALALAVVSISRVFGPLWYYLMTWAWGITSLVILAVGWTAAAFLSRRDGSPTASLRRTGTAVLVAATTVSTAVFAVDAAGVEQPAEDLSATMAAMVPDVLDALGDEATPGRGRDERYLVLWSDAVHIGAQGIALVNELERDGFDVGVIKPWSVPVARHRTRDAAGATSFVRIVTGAPVERWRANPDATEIASVDLRTPEERAEYDQTRLDVIAELERGGLTDLAALVDSNLFATAIDPRVSTAARDGMSRLLELGEPAAVFVGPASLVQD